MNKPIIGIVGSLYTECNLSFAGNYFDYNNNNYSKARKKEKRIVGKITVISKLGDRKGSNISDAKINLYAFV